MTNHAPTTWTLDRSDNNTYRLVRWVRDANGLLIGMSDETKDETPEHIVRCVNLHDELVKALEWALPRVGDTSYEDLKNPDAHRAGYDQARLVLAKAKADDRSKPADQPTTATIHQADNITVTHFPSGAAMAVMQTNPVVKTIREPLTPSRPGRQP